MINQQAYSRIKANFKKKKTSAKVKIEKVEVRRIEIGKENNLIQNAHDSFSIRFVD